MDNLQEFGFFYHVGSRNGTVDIRLDKQMPLPTEPSMPIVPSGYNPSMLLYI